MDNQTKTQSNTQLNTQTNNQLKTQTSFNIKPSDGIFRNVIINSIGDDNMTLLQQISSDNSIFFKVVSEESVEYRIYKALKKLKNNVPNMIKVYGSFGCAIRKKSYEKIKRKYEQKNGLKVDLQLCETNINNNINVNTNIEPIIKLKFIALENLTQKNYHPISNILGSNIILSNDMFCSLLIQGLYQLYAYYMHFGIIHYDCNLSNIFINLEQSNIDETIEYNIEKYPHRIYKQGMNADCDKIFEGDRIIKIKTFGLKILITDFDRANILHTDYLVDETLSPTQANIISKVKNFIENIFTFASNDTKLLLENYFKDIEYENTIACVKKYINRFNESSKHYTDNDYFIGKTAYIFLHHISKLIKLLNLPKKYDAY